MRSRLFLLLAAFALALAGQRTSIACDQCATWNQAQKPFQIYGNTYYVGPHGLSSILITSSQGDILIDGDLPQSAPLIAANIRSLGFHLRDVKLILNSHAHFDHAGGIAALQRLTGARVVVSPWTARVLRTGVDQPDDPQFGLAPPGSINPVANVKVIHDGQTFRLGPLALTAHFTPGHTPGGTSWTWTSCQSARCLHMVYADSLNAVSAPAYRYSAHPALLAGFQKSFAWLDTVPCDVLLTPHPGVSHFWAHPPAQINPSACRDLAASSRTALQHRLASEK